MAQSQNWVFELIPESDADYQDVVNDLWDVNAEDDFRVKYNETADEYAKDKDGAGLGNMLASGIVTWDTILLLLTRLVEFISNAALVVWSAMFIYAWYLYIMSSFSSDNTTQANKAIKNALIWVVIVIFSYAIQKIVLEAFLL